MKKAVPVNVLPALLAGLCIFQAPSFADRVIVQINTEDHIAPISEGLFGTGLRPNMQSDQKVLDFVKKTGITVFRYPDARDGGYTWKWPDGVMVHNNKESISQLGKLSETIRFAERAGARLAFTVRIQQKAKAEEAAEVVRQAKRLGITGAYWCLGNEPYYPSSNGYFPRDEYIKMVKLFAPAIKDADPTAKVGLAWGGLFVDRTLDPGRNATILKATANLVDFAEFHAYPGRPEKKDDPWDSLKIAAGAQQVERIIIYLREVIASAGLRNNDRFELHCWEWNGPKRPRVGGMHSLATALFGADMLGIMAKHNIKIACQHNLQAHDCGLIPGHAREWPEAWATEEWNGITVRPLAYAIRLWSKHMGRQLVKCSVSGSDSFEVRDWHELPDFQGFVPYLAAHAAFSAKRDKLGLILINKHPDSSMEIAVEIGGFEPQKKAVRREINGPEYLSHNDDESKNYHSVEPAPPVQIRLTDKGFKLGGSNFSIHVPAHSVTHLEILRKK